VLQIPALMVLWMDYTKVFFQVRETFHVRVTFKKQDVEIQGSRKNVQEAEEFILEMISQYDYVEISMED
jgi:hypothetical protein